MPGETNKGMKCNEFEALLSEAIEGSLSGQGLEAFQAHAASCSACGSLFAEVEQGHRWLKSLAQVEPPAHLVHNILVATSGPEIHAKPVLATGPSWWERLRDSVFAPALNLAKQPRFAMSFGMAFFSLSVGLNVAGVKVSDIRHVDLRPSAIRRTYYETSGKVAKYYDNLRVVYEFEARVREFKEAARPAEKVPSEKEKDHKNDTSGQPDPKQERNYSQRDNQPVLAMSPHDLPVVPVTTYRRFV